MNPPTWLHFLIAKFLERAFDDEIARLQQPWLVLQGAGQQTTVDSSRLPDISVMSSKSIEDYLDQSAVLTVASLLVVEIASEGTATQDYREKVKEYQDKGIREYWIADPDPFGASKYIGSPKLPTVSVYSLVDGVYQVNRFRGSDRVVSPTFPELQLTAEQVLKAGRS
jgi:Uma2 family endonuclease